MFKRFLSKTKGSSMVEYMIITSIVLTITIAAVSIIGVGLKSEYSQVAKYQKATTGTTSTGQPSETGGTIAPCGLCVLNTTEPKAIDVDGSGVIKVNALAIADNSNAVNALYASGDSDIAASAIRVTGGIDTSGNYGTIAPTPIVGSIATPNPLANMAAPAINETQPKTYTSPTYEGEVGGQYTLSPGIYNNITITNTSVTVTFSPGIYIITGKLSISGAPTVEGSGVMLYFTCSEYSVTDTTPCNGTKGASLDIGSSDIIKLTAPTTGPYQGISIYYDPHNTAPLIINGAAQDVLSGTVYAPDSAADITGSGSTTSFDSVFIVNTIKVTGAGEINLDSQPADNAPAIYGG